MGFVKQEKLSRSRRAEQKDQRGRGNQRLESEFHEKKNNSGKATLPKRKTKEIPARQSSRAEKEVCCTKSGRHKARIVKP